MSSAQELIDMANEIIDGNGAPLAKAIKLARAIRHTFTGDGETFALYHSRVVDERNKLKAENAQLKRGVAPGCYICLECKDTIASGEFGGANKELHANCGGKAIDVEEAIDRLEKAQQERDELREQLNDERAERREQNERNYADR